MDPRAQRLILIFEKELDEIMGRLSSRQEQAVLIFSRERRRGHFDNLFRNRFESATLTELIFVPESLLNTLIDFYNEVDELKWYLHHTEDMPLTLEQTIHSYQRRLDNLCHAYHKQVRYLMPPKPQSVPLTETEYCEAWLDSYAEFCQVLADPEWSQAA